MPEQTLHVHLLALIKFYPASHSSGSLTNNLTQTESKLEESIYFEKFLTHEQVNKAICLKYPFHNVFNFQTLKHKFKENP